MAKSNVKAKAKTRAKSAVKTKNSEDIIELILADHQPLKNLIKTLKDTGKNLNQRKMALDEFAPLLINHAQAEERALYSFMERNKDLREESFEGEVEHELAELMLESISMEKNQDMWSAKTKVLAELVEHHLKEEEKVALPDVRENTTLGQRLEMGEKYIQFKSQSELDSEYEGELREITASVIDDDDDSENQIPPVTH